MTRKDYVKLAEALKSARAYCETDNQRRGVERATREIADVLAADNGRFDRFRFYRAAGAYGDAWVEPHRWEAS